MSGSAAIIEGRIRASDRFKKLLASVGLLRPARSVMKLCNASRRGPVAGTRVEDEKHENIYRDLESAQATFADGKLLIRGITINIEPPRVIETVHEVLMRDDYAFSAGSGSYVMVDIGMNVAIASLSKAFDPSFTKVFAYEPVTPTYNPVLKNIELNPAVKTKIQAFNFGLSDQDEDLTIKFTPEHIMSISSESTFDACFGTDVTDERIKIRKASAVLEPIIAEHRRLRHEKVFLKIDCEGSEFKILDDLDRHGLLKEIDVAVIEWHGKEPNRILSLLTRNGFFWFLSRINHQWNVGLIKAARIS
jgi:FkbM family methyltransferase